MPKVLKFSDNLKRLQEINLGESVVLRWYCLGNLSTDTQVDGLRIVPFNCTIERIYVNLGRRGRNSDTILDINKAAVTPALNVGQSISPLTFSTMYTTQANRPTVPQGTNSTRNDSIIYRANLPDNPNLLLGEAISLDIDQKANNSRDLVLEIYVTKV